MMQILFELGLSVLEQMCNCCNLDTFSEFLCNNEMASQKLGLSDVHVL